MSIFEIQLKTASSPKSVMVDGLSSEPESNGKALEALDLAIKFLTEHEQAIDNLVEKLATINDQYSNISNLNSRLDLIEKKACSLEKDIQKLANCLH